MPADERCEGECEGSHVVSKYHLDTWFSEVTGRDLFIGTQEECTSVQCPYSHVVVQYVEGANALERRRAENVDTPSD